ncbi:serine--tRNA ligase [Patescibacteria group bacterium]|nr:serine--tRNA ligase [Patescibacteria group bacterium]
MLDIKFVRENQKEVEKMLEKRGMKLNLGHLLEIDDVRLKLIKEVESMRRERKDAASKHDEEKGRDVKKILSKKEDALDAVKREFKTKLLEIPNIVHDDVPVGAETANKVLKKVGEPPKFGFNPKDHVEIGMALDIIDIPRAAKVAGSRFYYLKNDAVLLELALIDFALKSLIKEGFIPILPPALLKKHITEGLGYWQAGGNENFYTVSDFDIGGPERGKPLPLYLIGTGEHAIVPMHSDEILSENELPKRYAAFSPNFRREAGSYGKDTHGILRVHQFNKVEMVSFVKPEEDKKEREKLLSLAEHFVKELELPYQVVQLASGDLAFPSAATTDIETWIPSQNKYRETHSISTTTDFQSRRLNIKYKKGNNSQFTHILNATAIAMPRIMIAIIENHQQKDGSVKLPKVLHEYMGKDTLQGSK